MPFKGEEIKRLWSHLWFGTLQPLINPLVLQGSLCMHSCSTWSTAGFLVEEDWWGGVILLKAIFSKLCPGKMRRERGMPWPHAVHELCEASHSIWRDSGPKWGVEHQDNQEGFLCRESPAVDSIGPVPLLCRAWYVGLCSPGPACITLPPYYGLPTQFPSCLTLIVLTAGYVTDLIVCLLCSWDPTS